MSSDVSNFALYGKGVFTTVAIRGGEPMLWEKHFARILRDMSVIGLDPAGIGEKELLARLAGELEAGGIVDGRVRITISDETASPIWSGESAEQISVQIIAAGTRPFPEDLSITVSPYPVNSRSPLAGVKSCNYLENLLAIGEAKKRGFHEAIRLNERGEITSACMANIFWLAGDMICTPSLKTGCLAGTTREYVLENIDCSEVEAGIEELETAASIFLTSAGLGIVEVSGFGSRKMERPGHAILSLWPPEDAKTRTRTKDHS